MRIGLTYCHGVLDSGAGSFEKKKKREREKVRK